MRNALYAVAPVPVSIIRGNPRILLLVLKVMIREFESRRGEILNLFAKKKKDQLLRAPSVGKHNSMRVDEGRKGRNLLAIKMRGTNRTWWGDPGSELRLRGREKEGRR